MVLQAHTTCHHYGDRYFAAAGPKLRNSLPSELRQADISFQRFKRLLKTSLFGCWDRGALWLAVKAAPHKFSYLLTLLTYLEKCLIIGTRWSSGTVPHFAIARSRVRLPPVAAVHQRQLSVPSLRGRLLSTSESWGVSGHTTRCTSSVSVVLQLRLVSSWGLQDTEISAALWALEAREKTSLYFTLLYFTLLLIMWQI